MSDLQYSDKINFFRKFNAEQRREILQEVSGIKITELTHSLEEMFLQKIIRDGKTDEFISKIKQ